MWDRRGKKRTRNPIKEHRPLTVSAGPRGCAFGLPPGPHRKPSPTWTSTSSSAEGFLCSPRHGHARRWFRSLCQSPAAALQAPAEPRGQRLRARDATAPANIYRRRTPTGCSCEPRKPQVAAGSCPPRGALTAAASWCRRAEHQPCGTRCAQGAAFTVLALVTSALTSGLLCRSTNS